MSKPRFAVLSFTCAAMLSVGFSISSAPFPTVYALRAAAQDFASHLNDGKKYLDKGLYTKALQEAEEALLMSPQYILKDTLE